MSGIASPPVQTLTQFRIQCQDDVEKECRKTFSPNEVSPWMLEKLVTVCKAIHTIGWIDRELAMIKDLK